MDNLKISNQIEKEETKTATINIKVPKQRRLNLQLLKPS